MRDRSVHCEARNVRSGSRFCANPTMLENLEVVGGLELSLAEPNRHYFECVVSLDLCVERQPAPVRIASNGIDLM